MASSREGVSECSLLRGRGLAREARDWRERETRKRTRDGHCGRARLLLGNERERDRRKAEHPIERHLCDVRVGELLALDEPPQPPRFSVGEGKAEAVHRREGGHAREAVEGVEVEAGLEVVRQEEGLGGEEEGRGDEEEGPEREVVFVVGREGHAEEDGEERGRRAEGRALVEEGDREDEGEDWRGGSERDVELRVRGGSTRVL